MILTFQNNILSLNGPFSRHTGVMVLPPEATRVTVPHLWLCWLGIAPQVLLSVGPVPKPLVRGL